MPTAIKSTYTGPYLALPIYKPNSWMAQQTKPSSPTQHHGLTAHTINGNVGLNTPKITKGLWA